MGNLLQHRKSDDKWRLYTTISEGWVTSWVNAASMKETIASYIEYEQKLKLIEFYWTFPHGYYNKITQKRFTNFPAVEAYTEWHLKALRSGDYELEVDRKYKELMPNRAWRDVAGNVFV
jgi:predicted DNA-binding ArsR family transcriptional regulator